MHKSSYLVKFDINLKKNKISPVATISHKSKAYRCIIYHSFHLRLKQKLLEPVNEQINRQSKSEEMFQLSLELWRLIATMADQHDLDLPFIFSKLDIEYWLWRMFVSDEVAWNFCYVLPLLTPFESIDEIKIVVPNSLQIGWCEITSFF